VTRIIKTASAYALLGAAIVFAATAGLLTATAFGTGTQVPTRTVTISVENGEPGPPGPAGPAGPPGPKGDPGAESCPTGSSFGELVINHPGGHVTLLTCLKNE
jgi:hypothetical protein